MVEGFPGPDTLFGNGGESEDEEEENHQQGLTEEEIALILEIIRNR
jgi:hypothetical protein